MKWLLPCLIACCLISLLPVTVAAEEELQFPNPTTGFDGEGLGEGIEQAEELTEGGIDIRELVLRVLTEFLLLMGLAATAAIIVAGMILVIGGGSDEQRELARKIIFWAVAGLIVILLAASLVQVFVNAGQGNTI